MIKIRKGLQLVNLYLRGGKITQRMIKIRKPMERYDSKVLHSQFYFWFYDCAMYRIEPLIFIQKFPLTQLGLILICTPFMSVPYYIFQGFLDKKSKKEIQNQISQDFPINFIVGLPQIYKFHKMFKSNLFETKNQTISPNIGLVQYSINAFFSQFVMVNMYSQRI